MTTPHAPIDSTVRLTTYEAEIIASALLARMLEAITLDMPAYADELKTLRSRILTDTHANERKI